MSPSPIEALLDAEVLAFLRDELPADPAHELPIETWYRHSYMNRGHGFAPYGYVIADFLEQKRDRFDRIVEIGAGFGQNCIQFAARGWRTIAIDAQQRQADAIQRLIARLRRDWPEICDRIDIRAPLLYPLGAEDHLNKRTVAVFSSLRDSFQDPEAERRSLDCLRLAGGLILDAPAFFERREQAEQDRLLEAIESLGFQAPVTVWDWAGMRGTNGLPTFFQHHRFVYFENSKSEALQANEDQPPTLRDDMRLSTKAPGGGEVPWHADPNRLRRVRERAEKRWEIVESAITDMLDLRLDESHRYKPKCDGVSVRAYPFPYIAALTLNNDLDSMQREAFEDWHGFVNSRRPTSYGDGLGLEIGDSMWVWGGRTSFPSLHRQRPQERPREDSPDLSRVVELGRLGWLDTLHSLTGWDSPAPPLRGLPGPEHANPPELRVKRDDVQYALDRLDKLRIRPTLYVNHSCAITNIAAEWPWLQHGDEPEHESYCLDLLKQFGFRFFWQDVAVDSDRFPGDPKFGEFMDYEAPLYLRTAVARFDWPRWLHCMDRDEAGGLITAVMDLPERPQDRRARLAGIFNRLYFKARARDGTDIFIFKRFNGVDTPSSSNFAAQVTSSRLDSLERGGGAVIIYNHFGSWSVIGRGRTRKDVGRLSAPPVLDVHAVACWQEIAERHRAGRLFVATSARLLEYLWARETLKMSTEMADERWSVTLHGLECEVLGRQPITATHLNGLSFLVPESAPEVTVAVEGQQAPLEFVRAPDPAFQGYHALYRPWVPLEWPEY